MTDQTKDAFLSALRSTFIAVGAYAAGKGWLPQGVVDQVVPALIVLATAAWGVADKLKGPK